LKPFFHCSIFEEKSFDDIWLQTGPAAFLANIIANYPDPLIYQTPPTSSKQILRSFAINDLSPIPILFQTGYLTFNGVSWNNQDEPYSLKIPNMEVEYGYQRVLCQAYFGCYVIIQLFSKWKLFKTAVLNRDAAAIEIILETALAKLSSEQHIPMEKYYHSVIQAFIGGMGIDARSQISSFMGKSDLDLVFSDNVYVIIEVKFEKEPLNSSNLTIEDKRGKSRSLAQKALEQITEKEYSNHYAMQAKKIIELGLGIFGRSKVGVIIRDGKTAR
jgi:hypothetical protein